MIKVNDMKNKFIILICFITSIVYASTYDWVVAVVNNEPITHYEIQKTMKNMRISKQNAINFLVDQKLLNSQIKLLGITVSTQEVDSRLNSILEQNKISKEQLNKMLSKQGSNIDKFRADLINQIKKDKIFGAFISGIDQKITEENIQKYYEINKSKFVSYSTVNVTRFFAKDQQDLKELISGKNKPELVSKNLTLHKNQMQPNMANLFFSLPNGAFTQIVPSINGFYEVIRINSKGGAVERKFEDVKGAIANMLIQEEQSKLAEEYFTKLRSKAIVKFNPEPK